MIAYSVIEKLFAANNVKLKTPLSIKLDFMLPDDTSGCYYYKDDEFAIHINPNNCNSHDDIYFGFKNKELSFSGYVGDFSPIGVAIHEISHFMCYQVYPNLINDYTKEFPTDRLYLNEYASLDIAEEVAEIMRLYIINPMLLKLIDARVYSFMSKVFKSPYPCSHKHLYTFYEDYPTKVRSELQKKWKIIYNMQTKKFERIDK